MIFIKQGGLKEFCNADTESLTHLVDDMEFYRIIARYTIANPRLAEAGRGSSWCEKKSPRMDLFLRLLGGYLATASQKFIITCAI